ncbi:MAG: hypothetical protein JST47_14845 [Bacteroidetes bacterium]|nr:hypothetical protein [Bacteroidota bacterium]MBS1974254.1 hypothetical protein [Bacteroidota bacterium]
MKKIICSVLLLPCAIKAGLNPFHPSSTVLVEARKGDWPITLQQTVEKSRISYFLEFRDEQVLTSEVLDTLTFGDLTQLKYFQQALSVLKAGNNGDVAKFKDYSIKRSDIKNQGRSYLLRYQWGLTNFRQPEADTLISVIRKL